jgi:hypothetical protein
MLPDQRKSRIHVRFNDDYNCYIPDEFYKWYLPLRDVYEELTLDLIEQSWEKSRAKSVVPDIHDYPDLAIPNMVNLKKRELPLR